MKAIKSSSKKAKGSRLERKFAQMIRAAGLDPKASRMPLSGASWSLRTDIHTTLPFSFECKQQEKMKFWQWWEQTREQATAMKPPVLVHSGNFRPIMVSMEANTFINLLKELEEYKSESN